MTRTILLLVAMSVLVSCGPSAEEIARANSEQAEKDHVKELNAKDSEMLTSNCVNAEWQTSIEPYSFGNKVVFALVDKKSGQVYVDFYRWQTDSFYHGDGKDWISAEAAAKALAPKECTR